MPKGKGLSKKPMGTWTQGGMTLKGVWIRFLIRTCFGRILCIAGVIMFLSGIPGCPLKKRAYPASHMIFGALVIRASFNFRKGRMSDTDYLIQEHRRHTEQLTVSE